MSIADHTASDEKAPDKQVSSHAGHRDTDKRNRILKAVIPPIVVLALVMWGVPHFSSPYWLYLFITGVIAIPIMQSLGVITGRVGVMSLCQLTFAMIGAYAAGWAKFHEVPGGFYTWMIIGGLAAVPFGLVIGLPALRLRGVNLAIVTFAFAVGMDTIMSPKQFPGAEDDPFGTNSQPANFRPAGFLTDSGYFRFVVIVIALIFVALYFIDRSRLGASWLEVRYSERGAAAHGTNVAWSKLTAFAICAFIAGVSGALTVGQVGSTTWGRFGSGLSLTSFAIAVVIGVRFWDAAIIAGLLGGLMPTILDKLHLNTNYVAIVFGVLAVIILAGGKGQLGQSEIMRARKDAKKARALLDANRALVASDGSAGAVATGRTVHKAIAPDAPAVLEIRDMLVRFGAVIAVDHVDLSIPKGGVIALLGPNGAGKSTLINAATGFAPYSGTVLLNGRPIDRLSPNRRAKVGMRRSFQQLRVPPTLTCGMFLSVAAGRRLSSQEINEFLHWFGCPPAHVPIGTMDVGGRRMLEVAGLAAGKPAILLLDEPAAGQGARETEMLSARISEIPERTGSTVLLVEHDIDLVRAACHALVVMDFGKVIASGDPESVLSDPAVVKAYVGAEHDEEPATQAAEGTQATSAPGDPDA